jgi:hypothetical protein
MLLLSKKCISIMIKRMFQTGNTNLKLKSEYYKQILFLSNNVQIFVFDDCMYRPHINSVDCQVESIEENSIDWN